MRSSFPPGTRAEAVRLRATGVVWLVLLALLVALSIATYAKAFGDHVTVTVQAPRAGMQLNTGGDVRMNGAIVGRVSAVRARGRGADVELQIDGDKAGRIPDTAVARILPTTLFGQKYVELRSSADPGDGHLRDGSVLRTARDATYTELTDVLDGLEPLLGTVRPGELSVLLHESAKGLDGQGSTIADLIDGGGAYLEDLNRLTPRLERDLRLLEVVSGGYADEAGSLIDLLGQATRVLNTLTEGDRLAVLLREGARTANAGEALLRASRRNLAEATGLSRPTLELLAEYSPEFPCVIRGFLGVRDSSAAQVKGRSVEGYFTTGQQVRGYKRQDRLRMGDVGTGPACRGLPDPPVPYPGVDLDDGVDPEIQDSAQPSDPRGGR
jgi:phospholipid/cholesterol/gamma-HCH transport system substrate-binding protein